MSTEKALPQQEIIDATQNAVFNAVDSVVDAIGATAQNLSGQEPFYESAEFWVAFSFVLVVVALFRPIVKIAYKKLSKRSNLIGKRIEDAANVYADAQKMLADYERKYRQVKNEAGEILNRAEREIALLKKDKLAKLEADMNNREREAKARIAATEDEAIREISEKTAAYTIKAVKEVLAQRMTPAEQDRLIERSISLLAKMK